LPYTFNSIISEDKGKLIKIATLNDIWDYIENLKKESEEIISRKNGKRFSVLLDIYEQLPFFLCKNYILDHDFQKDINQYVYCTSTSTPAFSGAYGEQPKIWIDKYYSIKEAIAIRTESERKKLENKKSDG
tara:strand:- start:27749 stop:28141 length:393 start_codon:yes stop_codon:yes gene_type:complete